MARLAHRRIPNDGQITALVAHLFSGPHCGHALQGEHPPSSSVANGAEASPEAFDSRLPPRDVASEDGMFCPHIPKLDSSAPCFIQSRTLVLTANIPTVFGTRALHASAFWTSGATLSPTSSIVRMTCLCSMPSHWIRVTSLLQPVVRIRSVISAAHSSGEPIMKRSSMRSSNSGCVFASPTTPVKRPQLPKIL